MSEGLLPKLLSLPPVRRVAKGASDWIDLQWSIMIEQLTAIAPHARGRLLDVGCGSKPYLEIFRPHVAEYIGIEHESTFASTSASAQSEAHKPDAMYGGDRLPYGDESFDTVLSIQVLEHTPGPQALLNEMARVLRRDGTLILSAPFCFRLHEEPHDYFRYSPHGLRHMCGLAGLEVTSIQAQGGLWSVLGHKLNSYLAFRVAALDGVTQCIGKLGHEAKSDKRARMWTVPLVVPAMGVISGAARAFDRWFPDDTEALSFLILARRVPSGS